MIDKLQVFRILMLECGLILHRREANHVWLHGTRSTFNIRK